MPNNIFKLTNCNYTFKRLYKRVLEDLISVKSHTILGYSKSCLKKMDLY